MQVNPAASPHQASLWHIEQTSLCQGMQPRMQQRMVAFAARSDAVWAGVAQHVAHQPLVTSLDTAAMQAMHAQVAALRQVADTLVVLGTGGASLGAQTLCACAPSQSTVLFLDNCDAYSMHRVLGRCDPARTAWVIISKSGETVETLAASLALIAHYAHHPALGLAERVVVVTSEGPRPLRALAVEQGWPMLEHPAQLGGRFSVFSVVGMFPALFAGMEVEQLLARAASTLTECLATRDALLFEAACCFAASLPEKPNHVVMGYADRLRPYTQWYKQLWAESLGKNGAGATPITAVGAVDQHSQLQLYLDGPRDKIFTLILPDGEAPLVPLAATRIPGIEYLGGHHMHDVMMATAEATHATMLARGLPVRMLKGPIGAEALVELMVRTMLETLLVATLLEVNPYDQPAVEEGKRRTRATLGAPHG